MLLILYAVAAPATLPLRAQSAATATLEFTVVASPSTGRPEKVMRHTFFLLRASVDEIKKAADAEVDQADFDAFVDELHVSPELQAWMKKNHTVKLQGEDFLSKLSPDEIVDIPEFRTAYVTRNLVMVGLGFPKNKAKPGDQEKNPEKWAQAEKDYWQAVRGYAAIHPESRQGMDDHLVELNPDAEWHRRLEQREQRVQQKFLQLLHARYLAAKAETNYNGVARIDGLAPGRYWLTNLDQEVRAGDVRLRWELPLDFEAGQSYRLELNNANAVYLSGPS